MPKTLIADIGANIFDIYARELILENVPKMYFRQFVNYKNEAQREPGQTIDFIAYDNVNKGGQLDEAVPIQRNKLSSSTESITLTEFGNAISFSRKAKTASIRELMEDSVTLLGRDYREVMDEYLRDIFLATANKHFTKADGSSAASGGTNVAGQFDDVTIEAVVEVAENLNMPKLVRNGESFYAFIGTPRQIRQIRNSSDWLDARRYTNPSDMLTGEAGRLHGVVFLQSTLMPTLSGAGDSGGDISRGVLIGADSVGYGESVPMELIPGDQEDYKRVESIAWYTIAGAGILRDNLVEVQTLDTMST